MGSSRAARAAVAAAVATAGLVGAAAAQQPTGQGGWPVGTQAQQIVYVDQEEMFERSAFGQRVSRQLRAAGEALAAENRQFEAELAAEERALTVARDDLPAAEFRARADAFDERVQEIRRMQEEKGRGIAVFNEAERQRFFEAAVPVLSQILMERGAVVMLDSRVLLLALDQADITDEAVRRLDSAIGDGGAPAEALPELPSLPPSPPMPLAPPGEAEGGPPVALPEAPQGDP